jgi:predicted dinucleotide-binding enzyme
MGGNLGTLFARAGHEVVFSYARSAQKLERLAREAHGKASAGTPAEAAHGADALLLAVHWSKFCSACTTGGTNPTNRVSCTAATITTRKSSRPD